MANFSFNFTSKEDFLKEITMLYTSNAIQESDIPAKIIKENGNFFAEVIYKHFNDSLGKSKFLTV